MEKKLIITGGAGFIGCHAAKYFAKKGYSIIIIDNLSRKGSVENLIWLKNQYPIKHYKTDIQDNLSLKDKFQYLVFQDFYLFFAFQHLIHQNVFCRLGILLNHKDL